MKVDSIFYNYLTRKNFNIVFIKNPFTASVQTYVSLSLFLLHFIVLSFQQNSFGLR